MPIANRFKHRSQMADSSLGLVFGKLKAMDTAAKI